tara:strand:- start:12638 stop:13585 length:948 start_codon:yes stop_codon:yes gene_type:complete
MINRIQLFGLAMVFLFTTCETDDVAGPNTGDGPEVTVSLSSLSILENGGSADIIASLSSSFSSDVSISFSLAGSAIQGVDYNLSASQLLVPAGSVTASITLSAIDDSQLNGNRSVIIQIAAVSNGQFEPQTLVLSIEDDESPAALNLLFNEVLYDPSNNGLEGDANGDGSYSQAEDEFIEIYNAGAREADLSNFRVYDSQALTDNVPRHVFAVGTILQPGKALVLFGGGNPTGNFGGATVVTSTTGNMNLNNAGDIAYLYDADGNELVMFDIAPFSDNPNESYTRNPDITGEFEQHGVNTPLLFSPGTKIDGSSF